MELYLSYADADVAHGKKIKDMLKPMSKTFGCTVWSMQDILGGSLWQREMAFHLRDAWLFLPLISADFFASDRCGAETKAALRLTQQGTLRIVNILLRPTLLELSPLVAFPVLPGNTPIIGRKNTDEAWVEVQRGIIRVLQEMQRS